MASPSTSSMTRYGRPSSERAAVDEARDAGMVEATQDAALVAEARQHGVGVHAALDQLERHRLLEGAVVAHGAVDGPHAAGAQVPRHAPRPDAVRARRRREVFGDLGGEAGERRQEPARGVVLDGGGDERTGLGAQLHVQDAVRGAGGVEKRLALVGRALQSVRDTGHESGPGRVGHGRASAGVWSARARYGAAAPGRPVRA